MERGLWGHPTLVNNPETLANVPWLLNRGAAAYRQTGTAESPGTKIFCLAGDIKRSGFIEVPLGIQLTDLVEKIGGGVERGRPKAIQIGGPSGGVLPYEAVALDYDLLSGYGAIMGSGGLVVLDERRCLVDLSRHLSDFMANEFLRQMCCLPGWSAALRCRARSDKLWRGDPGRAGVFGRAGAVYRPDLDVRVG